METLLNAINCQEELLLLCFLAAEMSWLTTTAATLLEPNLALLKRHIYVTT